MDWLLGSAEFSVLTEHLLTASIKGIPMLIAAAALCLVLKRASAAARHLVWTLALTSLLALPVLSLGLPVWQIAVLPSAPIEAVSFTSGAPEVLANSPATMSLPAPELISAGNEPVTTRVESNTLASKTASNTRWLSDTISTQGGWVRWAMMLWLVGTLLVIGRLLIGTVSIWWIARRASRISDSTWLNTAADIAWQIGLTRRVQMLKTPRITMPVTCGLFRSSILLPADADAWPDERRQVVLVHELAHVTRWDCLTQLVAQMVCSIYWFNPLVWLATRQLRIERERACDDQVIHVGTKASEYAGHLLEMARTFRSSRCSSLVAVAIARRSELEGRLLAILDPDLRRQGLNRLAAISVGVVIICVVLPLSTMRLTAKAQAARAPRAESTLESSTEPAYDPGSSALAVRTEHPRVDQIAQQSSGETSALQAEDAQGDQEATGTRVAIQQKDNSAAVEALREALKDEDAEVRQHALFALTQIGDPQAVGALIEALKDQSWQVRAKAAYGLGLRGRPNGIDALVGALRDPSWQVREQAAWGLGLIGDARSTEPLVVALGDESSDVRQKAAWALGLKGGKQSVEPLIAALKDTSASVREMAAWALGLKGDSRAAHALKDTLKDPDKGVRQKAAWAFGMLLMQSAGAPIGLPEPEAEVETEIEADRDGRPQGGVSGGVAGGIARGVTGGVASGISGGVAGGVAGGVSGGVGIGVGVGVSVGVSGGIRTDDRRKITNHSLDRAKSKPKQK